MPGGWLGIEFLDESDLNGASSVLGYCVLEKGGSGSGGAQYA